MAVEAVEDVAEVAAVVDVTAVAAVAAVVDVVIANANIMGITSHENGNNSGTQGLIVMFYSVLKS